MNDASHPNPPHRKRGEGEDRSGADASLPPDTSGNAQAEGTRLLRRVLIFMAVKLTVLSLITLVFLRWKGLI